MGTAYIFPAPAEPEGAAAEENIYCPQFPAEPEGAATEENIYCPQFPAFAGMTLRF